MSLVERLYLNYVTCELNGACVERRNIIIRLLEKGQITLPLEATTFLTRSKYVCVCARERGKRELAMWLNIFEQICMDPAWRRACLYTRSYLRRSGS